MRPLTLRGKPMFKQEYPGHRSEKVYEASFVNFQSVTEHDDMIWVLLNNGDSFMAYNQGWIDSTQQSNADALKQWRNQ